MILFSDIYKRAVPLFDDPDIRESYYSNEITFSQMMYPFLIDGMHLFTYPTAIVDKLSLYDAPQGQSETGDGEGTDTYVLSTTPLANSMFIFKLDNQIVNATYTAATNSVTFQTVVAATSQWTVEWYFAGAFTADFSTSLRSDFPITAIMDKIINIIAHGLVSAWSDQEMNRAIENRNILTDTDFKFYSPASSVKAKVDWHNQINKDMDTLIAELNWRILATPQGGSRFGQ